MAFSTNWNNIKPIFRKVTPMMILLCWMVSIMTKQGIRTRKLTNSDSLIYSFDGFHLIRIAGKKTFCCFSVHSFAFLALVISLISCFALFALFITFYCCLLRCFAFFSFLIFFNIFQEANFALIMQSIFSTSILVKFRNRFDLLAFRATFCLNCLRHYFLLYRKFCLEPVAVHTTAVGSFYYRMLNNDVKYILFKEQKNEKANYFNHSRIVPACRRMQ